MFSKPTKSVDGQPGHLGGNALHKGFILLGVQEDDFRLPFRQTTASDPRNTVTYGLLRLSVVSRISIQSKTLE
jgi:hypothetical protein